MDRGKVEDLARTLPLEDSRILVEEGKVDVPLDSSSHPPQLVETIKFDGGLKDAWCHTTQPCLHSHGVLSSGEPVNQMLCVHPQYSAVEEHTNWDAQVGEGFTFDKYLLAAFLRRSSREAIRHEQ